MWLKCLFLIVLVQRLIELWISRRNGIRMKEMGGTEYGKSHYKFFVLLHTGFLISLYVESIVRGYAAHPVVTIWTDFFLLAFLGAQSFRIWCITALGTFWNTRIFVVPGAQVVRKGPYRWFRHPNYLVVTAELLLLPAIFHAYWTGIVFSVLNLVLVSYRIHVEELALASETAYETVMTERRRVFPQWRYRGRK